MAPHSSARSPRSSKLESHTITWSARTTSEVGTVRPSALVSSILWDSGKHEAERYGSHHVPARPVARTERARSITPTVRRIYGQPMTVISRVPPPAAGTLNVSEVR
jgi:hypothetical protein